VVIQNPKGLPRLKGSPMMVLNPKGLPLLEEAPAVDLARQGKESVNLAVWWQSEVSAVLRVGPLDRL
jgi:hypothetical protein